MKALLVVEPPLHDQLHALISGAEFTVTSAARSEAWTEYQRQDPALLVVSSSNDDSAALELCRQVRSQTGGELKLIWIVTSRADPEQFQAIRAAAVDGCLLLPLNLVDVELRLATARRRLEELDRLLRTEDALRKSIERFDLAASGAGEGLWDAQPAGGKWLSPETPVWFSPRFKSILGFQDAEFPNVLESWRKRVHPDDWPPVHEALGCPRRTPGAVRSRIPDVHQAG